MSRPVIVAPVHDEVLELVQAGWARFHAALAEHGPADQWDKAVIDEVIWAFTQQGRPFSINDMRPLLPEVRKALLPARLLAAQRAGWIRYVGVTPSTLPSTKNARVTVYAPIRGATRDHTDCD